MRKQDYWDYSQRNVKYGYNGGKDPYLERFFKIIGRVLLALGVFTLIALIYAQSKSVGSSVAETVSEMASREVSCHRIIEVIYATSDF